MREGIPSLQPFFHPSETTMIASEPISVADVRAYLSMEPDDTGDDPVLESAIVSCRDRLESFLPYYLANRDVRTSRDLCSWGLIQSDCTIPLKGPVLEVVEVLAENLGASVRLPPERWVLDGLTIHADVSGMLPPGPSPRITVRYTAGAHVTPSIRRALLTMVRSVYERRDEDPMTDEVYRMVMPEMELSI